MLKIQKYGYKSKICNRNIIKYINTIEKFFIINIKAVFRAKFI